MQLKNKSKIAKTKPYSYLKFKRKASCLCVVLSALCVLNTPSYAFNNGGFFDRKAEGWFWYDDPIEPIEPEIVPEPIPEPVVAEKAEETEPSKPEPPAPFSSAWLRDNLPKYLDVATDDPTIENVRNYMLLQRLAMDKASVFSEVSQMAVIGDPFLDEATNRPFATFAAQDLDRKAGVKSDQTLKIIAERAGLFFFFDDGESSLIQAPLVDLLVTQNSFSIVPISVTGNDLFDSPFDSFVVNQGQAEQLDIKSYPALVLVSPTNGTIAPVAQSIISLNEMKQRILTIARRENIITDDEFKSTKPIFNIDNNLAPLLDNINPESLQAMIKENNQNSTIDDTGFIDPKVLSKIIEDRTKGY